jgi:hypothetical protein
VASLNLDDREEHMANPSNRGEGNPGGERPEPRPARFSMATRSEKGGERPSQKTGNGKHHGAHPPAAAALPPQAAADALQSFQKQATQLIKEHPVAAVICAFGLGLILGKAFKS